MKILLYRILQLTWGLPQSLMGFFLYQKYRHFRHSTYKGAIVTRWPQHGGVSLGMFIFVEPFRDREEYVIRHEYGHTIQSLILGPLYLIFIGIPSFFWANTPYFTKLREKGHIAYNSFIVEKLADRLGGNRNMKVGIANDHAATQLKFKIMDYLQSKGYEVVNYGTDTDESCDYPVYGEKLANGIKRGEAELGIAICGTGVGISIACNKVKGIRAGVCSEAQTAALIREHNNAQILCFGARIVDEYTAYKLVDTFLETPFSHGERHQKRIDELSAIEERQ